MTTSLSTFAKQLLARLTAPKPDHEDFVGTQEPIDVSSLSREELGIIWGAVDRALKDSTNRPARATAWDIAAEVSATRHWPLMTDEQVLDHLECAATGSGDGWRNAMEGFAWRADKRSPLSVQMVQELRRILGEVQAITSLRARSLIDVIYPGQDGRDALTIARYLQPDEGGPEVAALVQLLHQSCANTTYLRMELDLMLSLTREEARVQSWPEYSFSFRDDPRYRVFHEYVLRDACARVEAIHCGDVPYVADKAFPEEDAVVIAGAFRYAAYRKEPWLAELVHRLLILVSHAPDKKSKSLPSQAVCYALAKEIEDRPTPAGIATLQEVAKLAINGTTKRVFENRVKKAKTALALRPDEVLRLIASNEPNKKQQAMLATLLQASYWTDLDFSFADWQAQLLLSKGAGEFTQSLIWLAQQDGQGTAFMAESVDAGLRMINHNGETVQVPGSARIRLWHPLHSPREEHRSWQKELTRRQLRQPIRQAFREYYEPLPEELEAPRREDNPVWRANESERFASFMLSLKPLGGLARSEGWKIERESLVRLYGEVTVAFKIGADLYPGMDGHAESMSLTFWNVRNSRWIRLPIQDVPPVIYSEACRAADLLVSVTAYAYIGDDPRGPITVEEAGIHLRGQESPPRTGSEHPIVRRGKHLSHLAQLNIADMSAMRRQVLATAFATRIESGQLVFDGRVARIGEHTVHLTTAQVTKNGEQVELKLPKTGAKTGKGSKLAALPWLPYDEALLEKLVVTIAALL